jgi:hypothetical protein
MSVLAGAVQRVVAVSRHAIWYLDWHTGGATARL